MTREPDYHFMGEMHARYERGTFTTHGELGRLNLTAEQHACIDALDWCQTERGSLPSEDELAKRPGHSFGIQIPYRSALIVYAGPGWPRESTPDNTVVVFDARTHVPRDKPLVPLFIQGPTGERLYARGTSKPCVRWPVMPGDRVLIAMSDARAHQLAREETDRLREHPDAYAAVLAAHADEACMIDCSAKTAIDDGWPDVAHVTSAMAEHLNHPDAIAERTEAAELRPPAAAIPGESPAAASVSGPGARGLAGALAALLTSAAANEYGRVAITFMRGLLAAGDSRCRDAVRDGDPDTAFMVTQIGGTFDMRGEPITVAEWCAMRMDSSRGVVGGMGLRQPGAEYVIHVALEVTGLELQPTPDAPMYDVGYMFSYRFAKAPPPGAGNDATDGEPVSPWIMYRYWPRGGRGAVAAHAFFEDVKARTTTHADAIMRHMLAYTEFAQSVGGKMNNVEVTGLHVDTGKRGKRGRGKA